MPDTVLSIREQTPEDIPHIVDYFLNADPDFLLKMGVDAAKLYERGFWLQFLHENYRLENSKKSTYYLIWLKGNQPIGHCNINKIVLNEEAYMHLHLWQKDERQKGLGQEFLKMAIPTFFQVFGLKKLYCEPYALNPAPNKTLARLGFECVKKHETTPGVFNFHQPVNRWCLTRQALIQSEAPEDVF